VLFHIPHDINVEATTQVKEVQAIYSQVFPAAEWEWVLPPAGKAWPSSDGVHLDDDGARDFAQFLQSSLVLPRTAN
jgi:lysophospholipase L1-like esterase